MNDSYSTHNISPQLMEQLKSAIESVPDFGSIEVYIQNGQVTQISTRQIIKTKLQTRESKKNA